jgi:hypothetical protein
MHQRTGTPYDILTITSCPHAWPRPRYRDIIAYDRTRVLHSIKKEMDASKEQEEPDSGHLSNYVNASLILEPDLGISGLPPRRYFIAAQVNHLRTVQNPPSAPDLQNIFIRALFNPPFTPSYPSFSALHRRMRTPRYPKLSQHLV